MSVNTAFSAGRLASLSIIVASVSCAGYSNAGFETHRPGPALLVGYLRAGAELTLYLGPEDAKAHRYTHCINGVVRGTDPANSILLDGKRVEISAVIEKYVVAEDGVSATLAPIKNNCQSSIIFFANSIRLTQR